MAEINRRDFPRDEELYIRHTNLAKIRIARAILTDVNPTLEGGPDHGISAKELLVIRGQIRRWEERIEAIMEVEDEANEEQP